MSVSEIERGQDRKSARGRLRRRGSTNLGAIREKRTCIGLSSFTRWCMFTPISRVCSTSRSGSVGGSGAPGGTELREGGGERREVRS